MIRAVVTSFFLATSANAACDPPRGFDAQLTKLVAQTNVYRGTKNRATLGASAELNAAAQAHACDMARTGKFSHTGTGGTNHADRITAHGYRWGFAAENIALGQLFADNALASWKKSPPHNKNMLHRSAKEIGVGVASGGGKLYWVMVLAAPL